MLDGRLEIERQGLFELSMPIYEYVCAKCEAKTEAVQKFSDPPLSECPKCQGELKRIISRTSFQLKGAGWYSSDYKGKPSASDSMKSDESADSAKRTEKAASESSKEAGPAPKKADS